MGTRRRNVFHGCTLALVALTAALSVGCSSDSDSDPHVDAPQRVHFYIYDWEDSLLGPAKELQTDAGSADPRKVQETQIAKWIAAGRPVAEGSNRSLIAQGAEPTMRSARRIALREEQIGAAPQGSRVVRDQAVDGASGMPLEGPENAGYFVLNDDPALTEDDIAGAQMDTDINGNPAVTIHFTPEGRRSFTALTRDIAERTKAECQSGCRASLEYDTFAIVLGHTVLSRPFVDFVAYPRGLDARKGLQISGGFDIAGAEKLAEDLQMVSANP